MNRLLRYNLIIIVLAIFGCSDDKTGSQQQTSTPAPAPAMEKMAESAPEMEEETTAESSMEVPPWASLEQEVIYYNDE